MVKKKNNEFIAIDICKMFCAYAVVSIHLLPFADVSWEFMFWFNQVLCRLAVPFFFLSAGFFLYDKIHKKDRMSAYIKRLLVLYLFYTVLHIGLIFKSYNEDGIMGVDKITIFLKDFFLKGIYVHLWYLPALAIAAGICYLLMERLKRNEREMMVLAVLCYGFGVSVNAYSPFFEQNPFLNGVITSYKTVFETTRNGVFFGFPYVFWGIFLKKHIHKIEIKKKSSFLWMFLICLFFMSVEAYLLRAFTFQENFSMLFMTPITVCVMFLGLCLIDIPLCYVKAGAVMRKMSFLIYAWHMLVHKYCGPYVYYKMDSQWYYLVIILSTTVLSGTIVYFSRVKRLEWLKYLY